MLKFPHLIIIFGILVMLTSCNTGMVSVNNYENGKEQNQESNTVIMKTSQGDITIELFKEESPITVENFKQYVKNGFYNNTVFHRVIDGFMIQGGGFTVNGNQKSTLQPIINEADNEISNERGTIAMARTTNPNSATSQFFINLVDNSNLDYSSRDPGYAVFGKVISGMDVVDNIAKTETSIRNSMSDWPVEDIIIKEVIFK